ncbi:MAG: DUF3828 domain-containing protein [Rhizobiales bacterium]|nr:DUF3828 domain-containing protein [Hyphomicrobiales bacterium]
MASGFRSGVVAALMLWAPLAFAASAPAEAVRAVYEQYLAAEKTGAMGPDHLDPKLYTPRVRAMIAKLQKACKGKDICLPDADFLVDGQDFKITDLLIRVISDQNGRAMIEATFKNFDTKVKRVFTLRENGGRWLIDDIDFGGGEKLKDQLKPNP